MALAFRNQLFEKTLPLLTFKRFRGKINIQRPKPPHFERAVYLELAKPYYFNPNKGKSSVELCRGVKYLKTAEEENVFQKIISAELYDRFQSSRLIGFFHVNTMKADDQFKAFATFKKQNMHFKQYGKKTLELALKNTKFECVLDFYVSQNMLIFSPEPEAKKMLKLAKKFPQLILLAGILEGKFINRDEFMYYSQISSLESAQAGLVQTLSSVGTRLATQLNSPQTALIANLEERIKQLQEKE